MWAERYRTIFLASPANHGGQRGEPRARRAVARASNASKDGTAAGSPPPRVAVRAWRRAHAHHRTPARGCCLHLVYAPAVTCHEPPATTARRTLCLYISVAPTSVFGPSGLTCPQQRARTQRRFRGLRQSDLLPIPTGFRTRAHVLKGTSLVQARCAHPCEGQRTRTVLPLGAAVSHEQYGVSHRVVRIVISRFVRQRL